MRTIYIDSEHKCHTINDGTMTAVETNFFNGKCDFYIEGFCYEIWDNSIAIYSWKSFEELDAVQREYERQLLVECETRIAQQEADLVSQKATIAELDSLILTL